MATLQLKSSRNEQRAVIRFFVGKGLNANAIHSEMRPVYGGKCFTRPVIHSFGVRSLIAAENALLIRNDLAGMLLRRPMPRLPQLMLLNGPMGQTFERTWTIC